MNHLLHIGTELLQFAFRQVLWLSVMGSVLALLILALRRILGKSLRPSWLYLLWIPLLLRLLIPWSPESPISLYGWMPQSWVGAANGDTAGAALQQAALNQALEEADASPLAADGPPLSAETAPTAGSEGAGFSPEAAASAGERAAAANDGAAREKAGASGWWTAAALAWLAGALALLAYGAASSAAFGRRLRRESGGEAPEEAASAALLLERCRRETGLRRSPQLVVTDRISVPTVFGALRPKLLLPRTLLGTLEERQLRHVLLHELAHIKRRDIAVNLLCFLLTAAHWFNPLLALAFRKLREDQETACDELALGRMPAEERRDYGLTLLALLEREAAPLKLPLASGLWSAKSEAGRRIAKIVGYRRGGLKSAGIGALVLLLLTGCALTGPASSAGTAPTAAAQSKQPAKSTQADESVSESADSPETAASANKKASVKVETPAAGDEGVNVSVFEGGTVYAGEYNDPAHPGLSRFTIRKENGTAVSYLWSYEPGGGARSVLVSLADVTGDDRQEIVAFVPTGNGTELSLQEAHVLDFDTLEEIPVEDPAARLERSVNSSIARQGEDAVMNAELSGTHISKRYPDADQAGFISDRVGFGSIVSYALTDNRMTASLQARASTTEFPFSVFVTYDRNLDVSETVLYPNTDMSYAEEEIPAAVAERLGYAASDAEAWTVREENDVYRVNAPDPDSSGEQGQGAAYGVNRATGTIFDFASGSPIASLKREAAGKSDLESLRSADGSVYRAALADRIRDLAEDAGWELSEGDDGFEGFSGDGNVLCRVTFDGRETTVQADIFTGLWSEVQ
ncbi:hypothetical protein CDO73_02095 [Saccharibacillus sp. O23]|uniref:M56 family metallopeptidase n=1 Tax=Saccharibacillus sp. O23 TaxID=2009338 RepID=UPI000B4E649B|nr:M56 family metallopeptidase [Saccharibacillus sp. O23]OWR32420.1 hypothetical protein CDO73_02095 [Saccharibacillus sp. O23]